MATDPIPGPDLPASWRQTVTRASRHLLELDVYGPGQHLIMVTLERCETGRLRHAYPVGVHDVEVRLDADDVDRQSVSGLLRDLVGSIERSDPRCRRVLYLRPEGDLDGIAVAEDAGFRYVVDVDLPDGPASIMVAEPAWVTKVDMDLGRVPQT